MRRDGWRDQRGAATVEFVALTLILVLPVLYLVVAIARVQAGAYAAESAAYAAARAAVTTGLDSLDAGLSAPRAIDRAGAAASSAATLTVEDFGLGADDVAIELSCDGACLAPGGAVRAAVRVTVALPGVPSAVRAVVPAHVVLASTASSPVDGYVP